VTPNYFTSLTSTTPTVTTEAISSPQGQKIQPQRHHNLAIKKWLVIYNVTNTWGHWRLCSGPKWVCKFRSKVAKDGILPKMCRESTGINNTMHGLTVSGPYLGRKTTEKSQNVKIDW